MADAIKTSRLTLVPLTRESVEAFHAVWSDPGATSWSLHGRTETLAGSEDWMGGVLRTPEKDDLRSWAVHVSGALAPQDCIGIVTLTPKDGSDSESAWELGYLYRPVWWGKGYATESCTAAIASLKKNLEARQLPREPKLVAWVDPANVASLKVCEKLGFHIVELKKFGEPPKVKLGGERREDGVFVLERGL